MKTRIAAVSLIGVFLLIHSGGQAQDKSDSGATKSHRILYVVKNGDPAALAAVLGKHFKGEAEVLAVPAASGNALLISGTAASTEEVVKLVSELDRAPKSVEVELILAEVPPKKPDAKDTAEPDVSGPDVLAKLEAMTKSGQVVSVQRIKLTAVEGQPVATTTGGNKPYTSGVVRGGGGGFPGGAQRSVSYQSVGTTVQMTARISAGNAVALDLDLRNNQIKSAEAGDDAGGPSFDNSTLTTKLRIPNGRAVIAQAVRTEAKSGRTTTLVIVTARVLDIQAGDGRK